MEEIKMQYILDENHELVEIPKDECRKVEYPIKYPLKNAFEVFVRVEYTEEYWISNYGRLVNNRNRKDKSTFYKHKEGKCHYTLFEIERYQKTDRKGNPTGKEGINEYRREIMSDELVARTFLERNRGHRIWHKDGNENNNWYKNLIYVNNEQYAKLKSGSVKWQELGIQQEYIEYENKASHEAWRTYNGILARCKGEKNGDGYHKCYDDASMCQEWRENPRKFVRWYLEHYYDVLDESMAVDKDLFGNGSKVYSPETCCILPQGLNTMLSNCKRPYFKDKPRENVLPFGVSYSGKTKKYWGEIMFMGADECVRLSEWDTAEEAFAEYRTMKKSDVNLKVARYKKYIPDYIYKQLLKVEIEPY